MSILLALALFQDADWKAGLAEVKITPDEPVHMAGYASRNKPYEKVTADLYAKALALEDGKGKRAVLVTSDLIGFRGTIADAICERIAEKTGLKRAQVLLNSSHTHTGPTPSLAPSGAGMTPQDVEKTVAYTKSLQDKVADLVARALGRLEPAKLSWGSGVVNFPMNRREFTPRGVILGVNARGPADRSVPVLRVDGPDGKLRAVLFQSACHNTTLGGDIYEICGDFAGFAQQHVQEQNPGVQAMFMIGCGGDANPYPRGTMAFSRQHGAELGKEVLRVVGTKLVPVRGPLSAQFERVDIPLEPVKPVEELRQLAEKGPSHQRGVFKSQLETIEKGGKPPTHYNAPLAVWQFGDDLTLVGISGEVVVDYVTALETAIGPLRLWVAGYCNDVFGYLPSARVVREGGYETRGVYYGGAGLFSTESEGVVVKAVAALAEKAGRKKP